MRVLVTRAPPDAERVAEQLAALGHEAILAPVIDIVATTLAAPAGLFDATVATSAHALGNGDALSRLSRQMPFFAVGNRTAEAAGAAGFSDIRGCEGGATELAARVTSDLKRPARVLYLAGRPRKPTLEAALARAGFSLTVHEAYEARGAEAWAGSVLDRLRARHIDAALHFSHRSASLALDLARRHHALPAFLWLRHYCLSPDVAAPLRSSGAETIEVAPRPDASSLMALLTPAPRALPLAPPR